jgi:nicotinamidase-related amidase
VTGDHRSPATGRLSLPTRHFRMYPPEEFHGKTDAVFDIDASHVAFCLVDVYGLGHHPDDEPAHEYPALSSAGSVPVEAGIIREAIHPSLLAARRAGLPIVYVNNSAPRIALRESAFGELLDRVMGMPMDEILAERVADGLEYTRGDGRFVEISKLLAPEPGEYFIRKHAYSGFFGTRLDALLRNLDVKTLVMVGFSLDCCLLATMIDALQLDYEVVLLRDCTLATDLEDELDGLRFTNRMITWAEMIVGRTATSAAFIEACDQLAVGRHGA